MAPIGVKIWGNTFRTILQNWSSEAKMFFGGHFFENIENWERSISSRWWLWLVWKFGKTRFGRFCKIDLPRRNFFGGVTFSNKSKILRGLLPPEDGSDWRETLGKRVSDDFAKFILPAKFVLWGNFFENIENFEGPFTPKRMAPIGVKLWENAF